MVHSLSGNVTSPGYPDSYLPNTNCHVIIVLPEYYRIVLVLKNLNLSPSQSKSSKHTNNSVNVEGGEWNRTFYNTLDQYSAFERTIRSSSSNVSVVFTTDYLYGDGGYVIEYTSHLSCHNSFNNSTSGVLKSANVFGEYLNNQDCVYVIDISRDVTNLHSTLELVFYYFKTESANGLLHVGETCNKYDFVEVTTSENDDVTTLCGEWTPRDKILLFRSSTYRMTIRFVSNGEITKGGFVAGWSTFKTVENTECLSVHVETQLSWLEIVWRSRSMREAEIDCGSRGGHLIKITDRRMQEELIKHITNR